MTKIESTDDNASVTFTDDTIRSLESIHHTIEDEGSCSIDSDENFRSLDYEPFSTLQQQALASVCINSIRFLCVDAINRANSGHPGICMGMAPSAFVLFDRYLRFNPKNPSWVNRDRFVLSAGHGSMLLYSLLHLYGYDSVTLDDIKDFRKIGSRTPGHPENLETPGVEVSTGPLGQGICNAVGFAIAEAHMAGVYNRPQFQVINNYTYCIAGDGCMMEGMSGEACSLAGHLGLGKLIVLYDDNHISIDGSTDLAFSEDVSKRFEAYGWQVIQVARGDTDISSINNAIQKAKERTDKPTLIKVTTTIGYGAPNKQATAGVHGSALGDAETKLARTALKYEFEQFKVPAPAMEHFGRKVSSGETMETKWRAMLIAYKTKHPEMYDRFEKEVLKGKIDDYVWTSLRDFSESLRGKSSATRKHSKAVLNQIAPLVNSLVGGAADTSPSTLSYLDCSADFTEKNRGGRNIRFGVREHGMAAICNGINLAGYNLISYCSTFLAFSDYMRGAMRVASLSGAGTNFILTHDSVGLGEDGPTHQPIEQIASLRAMPKHDVWRPADGVETGAMYSKCLSGSGNAKTMVLSRQTTAGLDCTSYDGARRGGYIVELEDFKSDGAADGAIIGTGSELGLALKAREELSKKGFKVRVVSLPCWEEFERQSRDYKRSVLMKRERTVAVEAGTSLGWSRYADYTVCVDEFGLSGKGAEVLAKMGITVDAVVNKFTEMIEADGECV